MKNFVSFILLCFFAFAMASCQEPVEEVSTDLGLLIPRDQFVQVLTETQLLETARKQKMIKGDDPIAAVTEQYRLIFEEHGVSQEEFEATYKYYYSKPDEMVVLYDEVIAEIAKRESELSPGADQ
ncbi:MAG: DUF4296 domain-containing protein [Flavobacteriales bacterium]